MRNVLVTGANRGLGLGFTRHYLEQGWQVYAAARTQAGEPGVDALEREFGGQFHALKLDVSRPGSIDAMVSNLGDVRFDLVINNAGALAEEPLGEWTARTFESVLTVNTIGPALVAQSLLPLMNEGSLLVNLSSGLSSCGLNINPETGLDAYAASKAALNMLTRRLAAKLESRGIRVVAIDPGWVRTRMGGENAELSVEESIGALTATIDRITPEQSGLFLSRNGETLPW